MKGTSGGAVVLLLWLSSPAAAQEAASVLAEWSRTRPDPRAPQGENLQTPRAWRVRADPPHAAARVGAERDDVDIWFVNMTPGWHVTTGPAAILWHPASTANGAYRPSATIHLFDPGDSLEPYGLLFGGRSLGEDASDYAALLLRNDGTFSVWRCRAGDCAPAVDWTPDEAIVRYTPGSGSSVENVLAVEVREDELDLSVNGQRVARLPARDLPIEGIVGLRLGKDVNLHVSDLAVTPGG